MKDKLQFFRRFMIFEQEDKGYGRGEKPSGYIRIEVRNGKGKLAASVQNLKEDPNNFSYKLYILKNYNDELVPVNVNTIPINNGNGKINWKFDPYNVGNTGGKIDEFNVAVVLAEFNGNKSNTVICPLAAYNGKKKIQWRQQFKINIYSNTNKKVKIQIEDSQDVLRRSDSEIPDNTSLIESKSDRLKVEDKGHTVENKEDNNADESIDEIKEENLLQAETDSQIENNNYETGTKEGLKNANGVSNQQEVGSDDFREKNPDNKGDWNINDECMLKNDTGCNVNKHKPKDSQCAGCNMGECDISKNKSSIIEGDVIKFKEILDKDFQKYDPFHSRRKDYVWWKLNSPVQLNNILYQCSVKTPVFFNPAVMAAHFKYRHLITGIYSDRTGFAKYIVCGIPGVYNVDDSPFGEMCRWAQVEGSRPRYGAFGYWLVYIEPKSGKILNLN